jgi:hypothetical protein
MERRIALRTVATGVLAGLALGVGTAWAQLPQPDLSQPKLSDVQVQVPQVTVPQVQTPQVQTPQLQTPQLQTPQVQTPQVQTPQVQVPRAPAPVPSAPAPRTPVTSGGGGSTGGGGGTSGAGSGGGSGGGGSAAAGAPGGSAAPSRSAGAGRDGGDEGDGQAAPRRRSGARRDGQRRGRRAAAKEARLRAIVHRLAGCLDDVRLAPRRVLVLRSGYGPFTPLSRAQVADRLDLATPQVKRLERRGLRRLRALREGGGCGAAPSSIALSEWTGDGAGSAATPGAGADASGGSGSASGDGGSDSVADTVTTGLSAPASAVKDLFETSPSGESGPSSNPPATVVRPSGGIGVLSLLAFVVGLGLFGFAIRRELQANT